MEILPSSFFPLFKISTMSLVVLYLHNHCRAQITPKAVSVKAFAVLWLDFLPQNIKALFCMHALAYWPWCPSKFKIVIWTSYTQCLGFWHKIVEQRYINRILLYFLSGHEGSQRVTVARKQRLVFSAFWLFLNVLWSWALGKYEEF